MAPNKAAFMKATTPAEAAKILGHTDGGKKLRSRLRNLGVKVSKGDSFDAKAKSALWEAFTEGKAQAKSKEKAAPKGK